jgi:hypothetical protein
MYFGSNFDSTYKQNWKFGFGSDLFKNINSSFDADFEKKYQFKSGSYYLTLRSVLSLNNPQNSEMKFCENMKFTCWKSS